ncbi:MAG: hypothetical protein H6817_01005 [Phycisphaerales bacterium]|nr:hypothetical protein [Phycisphaerales bacterium]
MPRPTRRILTLATVLCFLAAATVRGEERVDYTNHKLVRVVTQSPADLDRIRAAGGEVLDCMPGPGPVDVRFAPGDVGNLAKLGLDYKIVVSDLGPATTRHLARAAGLGPFDDYMPLADIESYIEGLAAQRPDLCEVFSIGNSLEGRPIKVLHITGPTGGDKPGVFYHGLQHAREWITGPVVMYIANHLVSNYDTDPCVHSLVDRGHVYLAPCVNPDGYTYTWTNNRLWRKNRRNNGGGVYGVDLNRNWGFGWGGEGASSSPSEETYRGTGPFSEPETTVLSNFMAAHTEIRAYMDYHSYSQLLLWPFGYTSTQAPQPDRTTFYNLGIEMQALIDSVHGQYYEAGPIYTTIYPASGGSVDWAYGDQGIFAFTIELRPQDFFPGFELPAEEIIPTCEENLAAIMALTEWAFNDLDLAESPGQLSETPPGTDLPFSVDVTAKYGSIVPGSVKLHYRYDSTSPFAEVVMSNVIDDTYGAYMPATNCEAKPEYYFSAMSSTGQVVNEPCGAPNDVHTWVVSSSQTAFYTETFDTDPGWTTQGDWAYGAPTGGGGEHGFTDPGHAYTGTNIYGYNLNGDYTNNLSQRHLISTPIDCTGREGVALDYYRWLGVEQAQYDHAKISVSTDGNNWTTIWQNTGEVTDSSWFHHVIDISAIADGEPTVYLRWTMGTTDTGWRYCGWNIDDVKLTAINCTTAKGDWNGDAQIDATDLRAFPPCVHGPETLVDGGCGVFDFDDNATVDLQDYAAFQQAIAN